MTAYIVSRVNINDADCMASYFTGAPESVEAYGGKYLARTNDLTQLEGDEQIDRMVVLEFPTLPLPRRGTIHRNTARCAISAGQRRMQKSS
jgi:uncharacterized protein (DUF1330 family)